MARHTTFALGLAAAASLLLRAATGCGTSNNAASNSDAGGNGVDAASDAGDDGFVPFGCNGGCSCFAVDACPGGCYVSQSAQPDGSASEPFCSNGIVECAPGGHAWSLGDMSNSCPVPDYPPVYLDGSTGAFCCVVQDDAMDAAVDILPGDAPDEAIHIAADAAQDAGTDAADD